MDLEMDKPGEPHWLSKHTEWCIKTEAIAMIASNMMDLNKTIRHAEQMADDSLARDLVNVRKVLETVYRRHSPKTVCRCLPCEECGGNFVCPTCHTCTRHQGGHHSECEGGCYA